MKGETFMRNLTLWAILFSLLVTGCIHNPLTPGQISVPDKTLVTQLPLFAKQENEVEVADSMNDVDPTWVLGSIIHKKTGQVRALDNYLSQNAKPIVTPLTELFFKDFIENSVAVNTGWLDFLRAQVNDTVRAEVSVIKTSKVTIKNHDIDEAKLINKVANIPKEDINDYVVIIGYIDFVLTATLFKDFGTDGNVSGYGAKIGGKWYSKFENTLAYHRVMPICYRCPFAAGPPKKLETDTGSDVMTFPEPGTFTAARRIEEPVTVSIDLEQATREAIDSGTLSVKPLGTIRIIELEASGRSKDGRR